MFCREKLIFPLNWDIHGFGKLCPKGLDTLEIKRFCGALGSRWGGVVRDHVGRGYGKISQCFFTSVFHNAETPCPRVSCVRVFECEVRVFECEMSAYLVCRIRLTSSLGTGGDLATRLTSPVMFTTKAPTFFCPLGE